MKTIKINIYELSISGFFLLFSFKEIQPQTTGDLIVQVIIININLLNIELIRSHILLTFSCPRLWNITFPRKPRFSFLIKTPHRYLFYLFSLSLSLFLFWINRKRNDNRVDGFIHSTNTWPDICIQDYNEFIGLASFLLLKLIKTKGRVCKHKIQKNAL